MKRLLFCFVPAVTVLAGEPQSEGDGSSVQKAIKLTCPYDAASSEESKWVSAHYPGATIVQPYQRHSFTREVPGKGIVYTAIDEVRIQAKDGTHKSILFDVSYLK